MVYEEYKQIISDEFATPDIQREVREVVTKGPSEQYERVLAQEEDNEENAMKRMLTESSLLKQEKLTFDGSNIVPDFKAHEREKRKKVFE
jgi:hypothetical protein|tara:strand:+ start:60 stop:329 length:270 start_codon:yes stop_codon:yes gene_type:complete